MRPIDRGIVGLITKLNNAGYKTVASCSGMREDHPRGPRLLEGYISFAKEDLTTEQQEKIKTVAKAVGLRVWESPLGWKEYVGTSYRGKSALAIYIPESESLNASLFWHKFEDALFGGKFVKELPKINPDPDKALYFGEKEKLALSTIGKPGIETTVERLLAHLREAPQSKSSESYLSKNFGSDLLKQAYDAKLIVRSPNGIYTISLRGQEAIKGIPKGKVNIYEMGKRILTEGMTIEKGAPKHIDEAVWNAMPGYRQAEMAKAARQVPRSGKLYWRELTQSERDAISQIEE